MSAAEPPDDTAEGSPWAPGARWESPSAATVSAGGAPTAGDDAGESPSPEPLAPPSAAAATDEADAVVSELPPGQSPPAAAPDGGGADTAAAEPARDGPRPFARATAAAALTALLAAVALVVLLMAVRADDEPVSDAGALSELVPRVATYASPVEPGPQVLELSATVAPEDVAVPGPAVMACAAVGIDAPVEVSGHWQRDGQEVAATAMTPVGPPAFGSCVGEEGEELPEGAYQFLVRDRDGNESAAGTVVIGAVQVSQVFVNDGEEAICTLRIAPRRAGFYDAFVFDAPVEPGASFTLPVADVDQDALASGCGDDPETLAEFTFGPDPAVPRSLS